MQRIAEPQGQEKHPEAVTYLIQLSTMLTLGDVPDSVRIAEWQQYRQGLLDCHGSDFPEWRLVNGELKPPLPGSHKEVVERVDAILAQLPTLPDEAQREQLCKAYNELMVCREKLFWR